jgi:uncharacterized membrane protein
MNYITWGIVAAGLVAAFGRVTDIYIHEKIVMWSYWIVPFSLFAFGFIAAAIFSSLYDSIVTGFSIEPFFTPFFIGYTSVGILIAFIGAVTNHYIKDFYISEQQERDIEEQTTKMLESLD